MKHTANFFASFCDNFATLARLADEDQDKLHYLILVTYLLQQDCGPASRVYLSLDCNGISCSSSELASRKIRTDRNTLRKQTMNSCLCMIGSSDGRQITKLQRRRVSLTNLGRDIASQLCVRTGASTTGRTLFLMIVGEETFSILKSKRLYSSLDTLQCSAAKKLQLSCEYYPKGCPSNSSFKLSRSSST